jgi:hypothetical protein
MGYLCEGFNLVVEHWFVAEGDEWLGASESEGTQTGPKASDKDDRLHV